MSEYRVASSATSVLILSGSVQRRGATVFNHSNASLYLRYVPGPQLSPSASLAQFAVKLSSGSYFEVPVAYCGQVHGIWDAQNGFAYVIDFSSGE